MIKQGILDPLVAQFVIDLKKELYSSLDSKSQSIVFNAIDDLLKTDLYRKQDVILDQSKFGPEAIAVDSMIELEKSIKALENMLSEVAQKLSKTTNREEIMVLEKQLTSIEKALREDEEKHKKWQIRLTELKNSSKQEDLESYKQIINRLTKKRIEKGLK